MGSGSAAALQRAQLATMFREAPGWAPSPSSIMHLTLVGVPAERLAALLIQLSIALHKYVGLRDMVSKFRDFFCSRCCDALCDAGTFLMMCRTLTAAAHSTAQC